MIARSRSIQLGVKMRRNSQCLLLRITLHHGHLQTMYVVGRLTEIPPGAGIVRSIAVQEESY